MSVRDRVRVEDVVTLSDDWYVLKKMRFSFPCSDGKTIMLLQAALNIFLTQR